MSSYQELCQIIGNFTLGEVTLPCDEKFRLWKSLDHLQIYDTVSYEPKNVTIEDLVLVTAFSSNHVEEAAARCRDILNHPELQDRFKNGTIKFIAYLMKDLNMNSSLLNSSNYLSWCPEVELREFDFAIYPEHVKNLFEYRWKPIVIADTMKTEDLVLYIDSSVMTNRASGEKFQTFLDNFHKLQNNCGVGVLLFSDTKHSIFFGTNPLMYKYLHLDYNLTTTIEMRQTLTLWKKTPTSLAILNKWVSCSLIKDCMAPPGSRIKCNYKVIEDFDKYGDCHRYDQAALNLILANVTEGDDGKYFMKSDFFRVERTKSTEELEVKNGGHLSKRDVEKWVQKWIS